MGQTSPTDSGSDHTQGGGEKRLQLQELNRVALYELFGCKQQLGKGASPKGLRAELFYSATRSGCTVLSQMCPWLNCTAKDEKAPVH